MPDCPELIFNECDKINKDFFRKLDSLVDLYEKSDVTTVLRNIKGVETDSITIQASENVGCRNIAMVKIDLVAAQGGGTMSPGNEQDLIVIRANIGGTFFDNPTTNGTRINYLSAANAGYYNIANQDNSSIVLPFPIVNGQITIPYTLAVNFVFDSEPLEDVDVTGVSTAEIKAQVMYYTTGRVV